MEKRTIHPSLHPLESSNPTTVADALVTAISSAVARGHEEIVWLVSGGSSIAVAVMTSRMLTDQRQHITLGLIDERFGYPGHQDSNWQQLLDAGFDQSDMTLLPILRGYSMAETTRTYDDEIAKRLTSGAYVIGLFGVGADTHTAGLLPGCPALQSQQWYDQYRGEDFERITATPRLLSRIDEAFVYAVGEPKQRGVALLASGAEESADTPVTYLGRVKQLSVWSDTLNQ